jgi:hypothetical protein
MRSRATVARMLADCMRNRVVTMLPVGGTHLQAVELQHGSRVRTKVATATAATAAATAAAAAAASVAYTYGQ